MGRLLARLGIGYKRARDYIHSPDPAYDAKRHLIQAVGLTARVVPEHVVALYLDEVTVYRQPTLACAWAAQGREQPRACRSYAANTATRLVGALDAVTGVLHSLRTSHVTVPRLVAFFTQLRAAYPDATRLWVVVDNWPVHAHPDLLVAFEPQVSPFPVIRPGHWSPLPHPAAVKKWGHLALPIQLLPLPTYASWCNPIERVWRKLRQELGHLHPWADDLGQLRTALDAWLASAHQPSPDLLRYVGLAPTDQPT